MMNRGGLPLYRLEEHITACWTFLEEIKENPPFKAKMIVAEGWRMNNEATCPKAVLEEFKYSKPTKTSVFID